MSRSIIGDQLWADLTEVQKVDAVCQGHATLNQMSEGLLDGPNELRNACRNFLSHTGATFEDIPTVADRTNQLLAELANELQDGRKRRRSSKTKLPARKVRAVKPRFGLPESFVPRPQRYGRSILLQDNVYRLPDGQELIPQNPTGTLGRPSHLYALVTAEQYQAGKRGSIYIRTDGRIFNYSLDNTDPAREMFDTGYTINDLERTGRYAPNPHLEQRQKGAKQRRAAHAG